MRLGLLRQYIKEVVESHLARVPNQLVDSGHGDEENEEMDEFAGVGGVAGFTAPLGAKPDERSRK